MSNDNETVVSVTGSDNIRSYSTVLETIGRSIPIDEIDRLITRDGFGADKRAQNIAKQHDLPIDIVQPDWEEYEKTAGIQANEDLIIESDHVVVVWDNESKKARNLIEQCLTVGMPITIENVNSDGPIANSIDRVDLLNRLPELNMVEDDELKENAIDAFLNICPDYFWTCPSSSTGKYHPEDESGKYGNWLHTKRAFTNMQRNIRSALEMGHITEFEADCGRIAILMHDMTKFGYPPSDNEHTISEDDIIGANTVRWFTDLPETVAMCIETHNGGWSETFPEEHIELIHHYADLNASDRDNGAVYEPTEELLSIGPSVDVVGESNDSNQETLEDF